MCANKKLRFKELTFHVMRKVHFWLLTHQNSLICLPSEQEDEVNHSTGRGGILYPQGAVLQHLTWMNHGDRNMFFNSPSVTDKGRVAAKVSPEI